MADNVSITPGTGATIATDDIGGSHFQRVKLVDGTLDSEVAIKATPNGELAAASLDYTTRVEFIDDYHFYRGWALPGTLAATASWKITYTTMDVYGSVTTLYADGNANFDNAWTDRAIKAYS
jgi:hypothetical protein